jgi:type III secretion protein U
VSGRRTEEPTPRRRREARRRGRIAASAELSGAAALVGGLAGVVLWGPGIARSLATTMRAVATGAAASPAPDAAGVVRDALLLVARLSMAPAASALACAVAASALQTGFLFSVEAAAPTLERLDPAKNLRRLCSVAQLGRIALGVAKAALLVGILAFWWREASSALAVLPRADGSALRAALLLLRPLALQLVCALVALGLVDLALARRQHRRALMMTRDEVRRERREDEGDPEHRAEQRRIHRAIVETGSVARATVVVVNPTHLAVALRHDRGGDAAPRVVAKGTGLAAARIRSAARRGGVPIVRDVPLARALHRLADVGDEIPEELYDAAATLLAHLYGIQGYP